MKKILYTTCALLFACAANAQLFIQSGAGVKTTNDVVITVEGATITNNDATTDFSGANIILKGPGNILLAGSGNWQVKNLTIDKTSGIAGLYAPVSISERLAMVKGKLDLNNYTLTLATSATIEGESEENRIIGPSGGFIEITTVLNVPANQNPGKLGAVISSNANLGQVIIKRWHNTVSGEATVRRFYEIIPDNNTGLNATLMFYYFDGELNNINEEELGIIGRSTSQAWQYLGRKDKSSSENYVALDKISSFHQYGLGPAGVLPLQWGPLTVKCNNGSAEISWTTLQEENVQHFIVQQSTNGSNWNNLTTVAATGSSSVPVTYAYNQNNVTGQQQYRIMSVDIDGSKSYSSIKSLQACNAANGYRLHPVPAINVIYITFNQQEKSDVILSIIGLDGKTLIKKQFNALAGEQTLPVDISRLANGTYYVQVTAGNNTKVLPFVKQ